MYPKVRLPLTLRLVNRLTPEPNPSGDVIHALASYVEDMSLASVRRKRGRWLYKARWRCGDGPFTRACQSSACQPDAMRNLKERVNNES